MEVYQPSENVQNFINHIVGRFSDKFTKDDFNRIRNTIGAKGIEKYLDDTKTYLIKHPDFDFNEFYKNIIPRKKRSHKKMKIKNLLGYIINFCKKQIEEEKEIEQEKSEALQENKEQKSKEIAKILDSNEAIVEHLIKYFYDTNDPKKTKEIKDIKAFKHYFAKEYRKAEEDSSLKKLISCIHKICKEAKLDPEDKISINNIGEVSINKAKDIVIEKYDTFAVNEDEEGKKELYTGTEIDNTNSIEDILIRFFKDNKLENYALKTKNTQKKTGKNLGNLLLAL